MHIFEGSDLKITTQLRSNGSTLSHHLFELTNEEQELNESVLGTPFACHT